jgi:hypothetical protein
MPESAIQAEVFATSEVKKKAAGVIPKPKTALVQEWENGVDIPAPMITTSIVDVPIITAANGPPDIQIVACDICESNFITSRLI